MYNVITINPALQAVRNVDFPSDTNLFNKAARDFIGVQYLDFGTIAQLEAGRRLSIIVYEYGLVGGPNASKYYFAINRQLFNGAAVIFASDYKGDTISVPENLAIHLDSGDCTDFHWISSANEAERLIIDKKVDRPQRAVNGVVDWQWSPKTDYDSWLEQTKQAIREGFKF
jgi:hypothetical protein